jgi:myosin protein heavy chain
MASNSTQKRSNPFSRTSSPSPAPGNSNGRSKSMLVSSPLSGTQSPPHTQSPGHSRSYSSLAAGVMSPGPSRLRSNSKSATPSSNTFAPSFIKTEETRRGHEVVNGIEGENDFSGKRYVWLKDPQTAFVKGWVVEELGDNQILVQCDDGSVCIPSNHSDDTNHVLATRSQRRPCRQS